MAGESIERSDSLVALTRFGLGPWPGQVAAITSDPRGFVLDQLTDPGAALILTPPMPGTEEVRTRLAALQMRRRNARRMANRRRRRGDDMDDAAEADDDGTDADMGAGMDGDMDGKRMDPDAAFRNFARTTYRNEVAARFEHGVETPAPFVERLVLFWSNHFSVAVVAGPIRILAGVYERDAIRPHVLGRFEDMLRAAVLHPAMLFYLDNNRSFGPDSRVGRRAGRGINENLAREVLELHTLGVDGGYTQNDVIEFAYALTGWTGGITRPRMFLGNRHQPGARTLLGRHYRRGGRRQIEPILTDLARHPSTARHIARKLARHFVSDTPPEALTARLEATFRDTDGDLGELARVLAGSDAVWTAPQKKVVPPYDFVVATARATGWRLPTDFLVRSLNVLGQPAWRAPSPAGWPDGDDAWTGGDEMLERLDWVMRAVEQFPLETEPAALAAQLLGEVDPNLRTTIARAESREQAIALMLMSPWWQRR